MEDKTMTGLIADYENAKYQSPAAKEMRKKITKVLVLTELEKEKAKGIRANLKAALSFVNSGYPRIPTFDGQEDFKKTVEESNVLEKIVVIPGCIILLPIIALKMGINTLTLAKWLLEKKSLKEELEREGLLDNIIAYATEDKNNNSELSEQEYIDHLRDGNKNYNELMDDMSEEVQKKGRAA